MDRSRSGGIGIQKFIRETERELAALTEQSPKDLVTVVMNHEGKRLDDFVVSALLAAEEIIKTDLVSKLKSKSSYSLPPLAHPIIQLLPDDDYFKQWFKRRADKEITEHPAFCVENYIPKNGFRAIEIESSVFVPCAPYAQGETKFNVQFGVNGDDTVAVFKWLLQEWRRPIGQLLRGLPNLELWGNGNTIDGPKGCRTKDPAELLKYHLDQPKPDDNLNPNLFSMQSSFTADDLDEDVVITFAVFLCFFDSVYRLTIDRCDPDRLLRHYEILKEHLPKAPFRSTTIFPKE